MLNILYIYYIYYFSESPLTLPSYFICTDADLLLLHDRFAIVYAYRTGRPTPLSGRAVPQGEGGGESFV